MALLLLIQSYIQNYFGGNITFGRIEDTSPECQEQFKALDPKILIQMIDASAKSIDGILQINPYHLGNFDGCYSIASENELGVTHGKYCLGKLSNNIVEQLFKFANHENLFYLYNQLNNTSIGIRVGVCVPDKCTAKDLEKVVSFLNFYEDWCYTKSKEIPLSFGAYVTIAILVVAVGLVVVASICEFIQYRYKWRVSKYLLAFSFISNGKSLITPSSKKSPLACLSGIKAFTTLWIMLAHSYCLTVAGPVVNLIYTRQMFENVGNMFVLNATMTVDTFFTVTGLTITYMYLSVNKDKKTKFSILSFYMYRYLRITPLLAILVLIHATLLPHFGNGPLWNIVNILVAQPCQKYWWLSLFYILNWAPQYELPCMGHSWYLSTDFQMYLLSPIILILLHRRPKVGMTALAFLIFLGCLIPFTVSYVHDLTIFPYWDFVDYTANTKADAFDKVLTWAYSYFISTYSRFGPFVVGMLGGYIIHNSTKKGLKLHPVAAILIWFVTILGMITCIFGPYKIALAYDRLSHALFMGLFRNIWSFFISVVIYMCAIGCGGFINDFLSLPIFQFLAKLGYALFLIDVPVIFLKLASMKTTYTYTPETLTLHFIEDFTISLILSIFFSLIFETPIIKLTKELLSDKNTKKSEKTETNKINKTD